MLEMSERDTAEGTVEEEGAVDVGEGSVGGGDVEDAFRLGHGESGGVFEEDVGEGKGTGSDPAEETSWEAHWRV